MHLYASQLGLFKFHEKLVVLNKVGKLHLKKHNNPAFPLSNFTI